MSRLEDELRAALQPIEPPPGFADRVLARLPRKTYTFPRWYAAAAVLLLTIAGAGTYQYQRTRHEAEKARADLVFALGVTSEKLQHTKALVLKQMENGI
jgi:hypothetical protein